MTETPLIRVEVRPLAQAAGWAGKMAKRGYCCLSKPESFGRTRWVVKNSALRLTFIQGVEVSLSAVLQNSESVRKAVTDLRACGAIF